MDIYSLKGFRDFYPEEMSARREVFSSIRNVANRYGYNEVDAPSLEALELYEVKSGDEILEDTYSFKDKGGRMVTMTPEITPSIVRMFSSKQQAISKPAKWFSIPKLWRYEQPQSGRLREFFQPNFDIYGVEEKTADAELISLANDILQELGLTDEYRFRISHRELIQGIIEEMDLSGEQREKLYRVIDKSERLEEDEIRERLRDIDLESSEINRLIDITSIDEGLGDCDKILEYTQSEKTERAVNELLELSRELERMECLKKSRFDPSIIRGLDYYTGIVFECFDVEGELRAIFGGGRYDDLVEEFGGQPTPATGFGLGDATLELLLKQSDQWPSEEIITDYYIAILGDTREEASSIARYLRDSGNRVEMNMEERGLSSQLDRADAVNAEKTIIVGERDIENGVVTVKDMDSGEQLERNLEEYR